MKKGLKRAICAFTCILLMLSVFDFTACKNGAGIGKRVSYDTGFTDGNFENEEIFSSVWSGWAPSGTDHFFDALSHTEDGTGSLKVTHYLKSASSSSWGQKIHVVEDAKYKISAWIKTESLESYTHNGNGGAYITLDGTTNYTGIYLSFNAPQTQEWTYYEAYYTASFTGEAGLMCRVWGCVGTAYFDEIKVELIEKVDPEIAKHWAKEKDIDFPEKGKGFTLVAIGDPQIVVSGNAQKYYDGMQRIIDKADKWNVLYTMDVGDLVDSCVPEQWSVSVKGHEMFDEAGLKYALAVGNHDYGNNSSSLIGLAANEAGEYRKDNPKVLIYDHSGYERAYPLEKYANMYGSTDFGTLDGTMSNTWHKFSYEGEKYMIIALEFAPLKDTVKAAKQMCDDDPDTHVIVVTHAALAPKTLILQDEQTAHIRKAVSSNELWKSFIKTTPNVFLVCSGHFDCHGTAASVMYNDCGDPVTYLCVDPQGTLNGGELMAAFIHIENGTDMTVYTYSPTKDLFYNGSNYRFSMKQGTRGDKGGILELEKGYSGPFFENIQLDGTAGKVTYTCRSSDPDVVFVSEDGKITALKEGKATVTVVIDRHRSAYCLDAKGVPIGSQTKFTVDIVVK